MQPHDFTATFQTGIVLAVDDARHALRVKLPALENMETDWLPMITANAGGNRFYALPDEGELVACLLDARGESGVVLGAIYNEEDKTPAASRDIWCKEFTNGTRIEHNRATGQVTVDTPGQVLVKSAVRVLIDSPLTETTGNLNVGGWVHAAEDVKAGDISLQNHDHTIPVGKPV